MTIDADERDVVEGECVSVCVCACVWESGCVCLGVWWTREEFVMHRISLRSCAATKCNGLPTCTCTCTVRGERHLPVVAPSQSIGS